MNNPTISAESWTNFPKVREKSPQSTRKARLLRLRQNAIDNDLNRFRHAVAVDVMHINGMTDGFKHRHCQSASEVLAEFFQAVKQFVRLLQCRMIDQKSETLQRELDL